MKKRITKLTLVRETLNRLEGGNLKEIQGGSGCATSESCLYASGCACVTFDEFACGGTGSVCPSMTGCSNCD